MKKSEKDNKTKIIIDELKRGYIKNFMKTHFLVKPLTYEELI